LENSNLTKPENHFATGLQSNIFGGIQSVAGQETFSADVPPTTFWTIRW